MIKYELSKFIEKYKVVAKKSFGQNFLQDLNVINTIIESFDYSRYDKVIEIGPGLGALTIPLVNKNIDVLAIESDRDMFSYILDILKDSKARVECSDFRHFNMPQDIGENILLMSNLPYNLTYDLIVESLKWKPITMGFMVQYEVAMKYLYKEGKKENDALGAFLNLIGEVKIITKVDSSCFNPAPKVESAFIVVDNLKYGDDDFEVLKIFGQLFKNPNKTLLNNIKAVYPNVVDKISMTDLLSFRARQLQPQQLKELALEILKKKA